MKKKNIVLNYLLILMAVFMLAACTDGTSGNSSENVDKSNGASNESSEDIIVGVPAEPATLMGSKEPAASTSMIIRNVYGQLIDYDGNGNFIPMLATEWKAIDELTWEFKLRQGVKFHNGADFNAKSVEYTMNFMLDPENQSAYGSRWKNELAEFKVIDDYTFQIKTKKPNAGLLHRVYTDFQPLEPGYVEEVGIEEASQKPIGTGAYKVVEWKRGESITFEANEEYWEGSPSIKKVTVKFVPEFSSRLSALLNGEIDLIKGVPVDSVNLVESEKDTKVISALTGKPSFVLFNTFKDGPLRDIRVRQAINYGLDVDKLIENVMNGRAERLYGSLTPFNASYKKLDGYKYDPEKAKQLLKEAGYENGLDLVFDTTNGYFPMDSQIVQAIAGELKQIGINITIQQHESGVYIKKATSQNMDDMYFYTAAASTEGESLYSFFYTNSGIYRFSNNTELLDYIESKFVIFDPTERQKAMDEIQQRISDEALILPLWIAEDIWGAKKDIDFKPKFNETLNFYTIKRGN